MPMKTFLRLSAALCVALAISPTDAYAQTLGPDLVPPAPFAAKKGSGKHLVSGKHKKLYLLHRRGLDDESQKLKEQFAKLKRRTKRTAKLRIQMRRRVDRLEHHAEGLKKILERFGRVKANQRGIARMNSVISIAGNLRKNLKDPKTSKTTIGKRIVLLRRTLSRMADYKFAKLKSKKR